MTQKIKIISGDETANVVAWSRKATAAAIRAEEQYRLAVLTGKDEHKIAFFNETQRVREIQQAINIYFGS